MLEALEDRNCPSTITLTANVLPNTQSVYFMGQVTNTPNLGGLTVDLTGVATGTATTSSNGRFIVALKASSLGTEYAATADGQSNTAQVVLTDPAPTITQFSSSEHPGDLFVFTGHVTGGYQGETVTLGGIPALQGQTATLDSNGNFTISEVLDGQMDDNGDATAQVADAWGTTSNLATSWVSQT